MKFDVYREFWLGIKDDVILKLNYFLHSYFIRILLKWKTPKLHHFHFIMMNNVFGNFPNILVGIFTMLYSQHTNFPTDKFMHE